LESHYLGAGRVRRKLCYNIRATPLIITKISVRQMRCVLNRFLRGTCIVLLALVAFGAANAQDFNGFYVGANAGGAFGHFDAKLSTVFSPTGYFATTSVPAIATVGNQKIQPNGFSAGGGAGFGHQWDNFYFGLEADYQTMSLSGSKTGS